jgi:hypothetical protein
MPLVLVSTLYLVRQHIDMRWRTSQRRYFIYRDGGYDTLGLHGVDLACEQSGGWPMLVGLRLFFSAPPAVPRSVLPAYTACLCPRAEDLAPEGDQRW